MATVLTVQPLGPLHQDPCCNSLLWLGQSWTPFLTGLVRIVIFIKMGGPSIKPRPSGYPGAEERLYTHFWKTYMWSLYLPVYNFISLAVYGQVDIFKVWSSVQFRLLCYGLTGYVYSTGISVKTTFFSFCFVSLCFILFLSGISTQENLVKMRA